MLTNAEKTRRYRQKKAGIAIEPVKLGRPVKIDPIERQNKLIRKKIKQLLYADNFDLQTFIEQVKQL